MNTMARTTVLTCLTALSLALAGPAAHAEVYKWVDENGKTQFSDKPPPNQKNVKQLDLKDTTVSPADRAAAEQRAAAAKARAQAGTSPKAPAKADAKDKPLEAANDGKSEYQKSLDCFAKYRGPNGRLSPEAGANCKEVAVPN